MPLKTWNQQLKAEMSSREELVISHLVAARGNVTQAARALEMDRPQLHRFIRERGLRQPAKLARAGFAP